MKVYKLDVIFDDFGTNWDINIGLFTDKSSAEIIKQKWMIFFNELQDLLNEPENWNPESDKWFKENTELTWDQSFEYQERSMKYSLIKQFIEIKIEEIIINKDNFIEKFKGDDFSKLMKDFDRNYKLNNILNHKLNN